MSTRLLETIEKQLDKRMADVKAIRSLAETPGVSLRLIAAAGRLEDEWMKEVKALWNLRAAVGGRMDREALGIPEPPDMAHEFQPGSETPTHTYDQLQGNYDQLQGNPQDGRP